MGNKKAKTPRLKLADLIESARKHRAEIGEEAWARMQEQGNIQLQAQIAKTAEWLKEFGESSEHKAREALQHRLDEILGDPIIRQSETCIEVVEAVLYCVKYNWGAKDSEAMLRPIANEFEKLKATEMASVKHGESNKAKAWVKSEWQAYKAEYEGNKSAFSRDYVRRCLNEYAVTVTEKQMREVWLKDTPPASKPDGMPANGE